MSRMIGLRIRALRRLKRVTQQELAGMIGISVTSLSHIERGRKTPSPQLLENIALQLELPKEDLFIIKERNDISGNAESPGRAKVC